MTLWDALRVVAVNVSDFITFNLQLHHGRYR
jgi:hypothetical protein